MNGHIQTPMFNHYNVVSFNTTREMQNIMPKLTLKLDALFAPDESEFANFTLLNSTKEPIANITINWEGKPKLVSAALRDGIDHFDLARANVAASEMIHAFFDDVERPDDFDFYECEI
jgi:hypothetical protein